MNKNFKLGQTVVCTFGSNKGKEFIITAILKDTYSCKLVDDDGKYYEYNDRTLEEK